MTPQEKAKKLVWDYYHMLEHTISDEYSKQDWEISKKCALMITDEILNLHKIASLRRDKVYMELEYWEEVEKEINLL